MLGFGEENDNGMVTDQALIAAIRKRMLEDIEKRKEAASIVNNVYGSGAAGAPGGVMDRLSGGAEGDMSPEEQSYFVDILRQNYDPGDEAEMIDPETGEPIKRPLPRGGWAKRVHRFSAPKKKMQEL
jgi:hypothetical protein